MSALSPLEIAAVIWAAILIIYVALFLFRSLVGMREEDTIYLSAGEAKLAEEQRQVQVRMGKLDGVIHKVGWVALAMTAVVVGIWGYGVYKTF